MRNSIFLLSVVISVSCQTGKNAATEEAEVGHHHVAEIEKVFDAHGGYATWLNMQQLSFNLDDNDQHQVISLPDRKVLIQSERKTIGFDGRDVWIMPDSAEIGNARFYHNLYFYFYAMPFVLGDPGTIYEKVGPRSFLGVEYEGIKVSFREDVGDSPKDNYILYYDPETYKMAWLMYTVTYHSRSENDQYSLIKYNDWEKYNGLLLPTKLQWYEFKNDSVGRVRSERNFKNIRISTEAPSDKLFEMPAGARIAPKPAN